MARASISGDKSTDDHIEREQCSRVHLDAITSDDAGSTVYAFRGHHFLSITGDKFHSDTIESAFKELHSEVDAVFSYEGHLYMIKDKQVFVHKVGEPHTHLEGYPKSLKEVLGIEGPVHAAFCMCADKHVAHVIKGQTIYDVDLKVTPCKPMKEGSITQFKRIDAAMCGPKGLTVVIGNHYYIYDSHCIADRESQGGTAHLPGRLLNGDADVIWRIVQMFMRTKWCASHMTTNNPFYNIRPIFSALKECRHIYLKLA
ncbi:LOW QUALITY PROTEIN: hemopexin [Pimephales promelas]|uniref:LOW QUALITY PROTEIN: hemopexin n=1 Tax=Pimephales promelas TaxID=90988 RepID=UPI001955ACFA|nr:LOW QUALITY PROTEIN: hemopexin [Pimephales promelas]